MIVTDRLTLVPATVALARAEIGDRAEFARLLEAAVPDHWPPESAADALPLFLSWLEAAPDRIGWFGWYALARVGDADRPALVGGGGFLGPPQGRTVQIGYSVLPEFQRRGYATEMVAGLVRWALARSGVDSIAAETEWANPASVRVLEKVGFTPVGSASEPGGARFELRGKARIDETKSHRASTRRQVRGLAGGVASAAEMGRLTHAEVGRRERHTRRGERRRVCAQTKEGRRG